MAWVSDVHGKYYNDKIGYYKSKGQDVESDFEEDPDYAFDERRKHRYDRSKHDHHHHNRNPHHARKNVGGYRGSGYDEERRQRAEPHWLLQQSDDACACTLKDQLEQQQRLGRLLKEHRRVQTRANSSPFDPRPTALDGFEGLTEEEKRYVFDNVLQQKDINSVIRLLTVVSIGVMSLVGLKIAASFIVEMSKQK